MPRHNHPEKRKPSQKKMRKIRKKEMEKGKKMIARVPYLPGEDEYGF